MIDIHTHILPGIDDGAESITESIAMLEMLSKQGVSDVVATPHFKPSLDDTVEQFLERRDASYKALMEAVGGRSDLPKIHLGAEATICVDMADIKGLDRLCIEGTRYILIELDISSFGSWVFNTLFEIGVEQQVTPIIAHIDRYIHVLRRDTIKDLMALGCPVQMNISALFHHSVRFDLIKLIREYPDQICLVGSDCHDTVYRKPEWVKFARKSEKKIGEGYMEFIEDRSRRLLDGKEI